MGRVRPFPMNTMMKRATGLSGLLFFLGCIALPAFAVDPVFSDRSGKAIKGYDPVSYFTESRARQGVDDFSYEWRGADWYFSSARNREAFIEDPEKYAPQYGGYCAYAVSRGYTAQIDPDAWHIHEDRLYLNFSRSVQRTWRRDVRGNVAAADDNWPSLSSGGQ